MKNIINKEQTTETNEKNLLTFRIDLKGLKGRARFTGWNNILVAIIPESKYTLIIIKQYFKII